MLQIIIQIFTIKKIVKIRMTKMIKNKNNFKIYQIILNKIYKIIFDINKYKNYYILHLLYYQLYIL